MKNKLIALVGPAGCGKTTIAKYLEQKGTYVHLKFADGLKNMLRSIGLSEEELEGGLKETQSKTLLGITPRHAMQTLGTEWGRDCIHKDLWAHIFKLRAEDAISNGYSVVVDDLRFLNEEEAIKELNGIIIRVTKDNILNIDGSEHQSETEAIKVKENWGILNGSTIEALLNSVEIVLNEEEKK